MPTMTFEQTEKLLQQALQMEHRIMVAIAVHTGGVAPGPLEEFYPSHHLAHSTGRLQSIVESIQIKERELRKMKKAHPNGYRSTSPYNASSERISKEAKDRRDKEKSADTGLSYTQARQVQKRAKAAVDAKNRRDKASGKATLTEVSEVPSATIRSMIQDELEGLTFEGYHYKVAVGGGQLRRIKFKAEVYCGTAMMDLFEKLRHQCDQQGYFFQTFRGQGEERGTYTLTFQRKSVMEKSGHLLAKNRIAA